MVELERQEEIKWLNRVLTEIGAQLQEVGVTSAMYRRRVQDVRKLIWEDLQISSADSDTYDELAQHIMQLGEERGAAIRKYKQMRRLLSMQDSPYFGRFDFQPEDFPFPESFYIGIGTIVDRATGIPLVYDWRAPISSLFYDYGLGPASYTAPMGTIYGTITKKRQYKIENGKLLYMLDTDLKIDDEMLQRALSDSTDETMRTIVTTIQREQNRAIRYEDKPVLIVTGPAGSGKTSVALHRIAYILYKHRENTSANDVIIFSPSNVFSEYISDVLPELGEENVLQTTFQEFAESTLRGLFSCESLLDFQEQLAAASPEERERRLARLEAKSSSEFVERLEDTVQRCASQGIEPQDVTLLGKIIFSKDEIQRMLTEDYAYLPYRKRLDKVRNRVLTKVRPLKKAAIEKRYRKIRDEDVFIGEGHWEWARKAIEPVRKEYRAMLAELDGWLTLEPIQVYLRMLTPEEREGTESAIAADRLLFEDVAPVLFVKGELQGYPAQNHIRQVVLDEGQDYSEIQLRIIKALFPRARFTILGDENQLLNPSLGRGSGLANAHRVFAEGTVERFHLRMTYRSTQEITNFCLALLPEDARKDAIPLVRSGAKPLLTPVEPEQHAQAVKDFLTNAVSQDFKTKAVICKSAAQAKEVHAALADLEPQLIIDEDDNYKSGIVVIPYYLAKGLEFDAVVIWDANAEAYSQPYHRHQLYVACSRALHELAVFYTNNPSPFVAQLPSGLYRTE